MADSISSRRLQRCNTLPDYQGRLEDYSLTNKLDSDWYTGR